MIIIIIIMIVNYSPIASFLVPSRRLFPMCRRHLILQRRRWHGCTGMVIFVLFCWMCLYICFYVWVCLCVCVSPSLWRSVSWDRLVDWFAPYFLAPFYHHFLSTFFFLYCITYSVICSPDWSTLTTLMVNGEYSLKHLLSLYVSICVYMWECVCISVCVQSVYVFMSVCICMCVYECVCMYVFVYRYECSICVCVCLSIPEFLFCLIVLV